MKIRLICHACATALIEHGANVSPIIDVPLGDTPAYDIHCPQGHRIRIVLENPKFELLFESGIRALQDGYFREAISSFAAALERFYEFLTQSHFVTDLGKLPESFVATWKIMSKQSERQLGAFCMLYLRDFGESAPLFDKAFVKESGFKLGVEGNDPVYFRNLVTHQGYIPKREHALAYGEALNKYFHLMLVDYCRTRGKSIELVRAKISAFEKYYREESFDTKTENETLVSATRYMWNIDLNRDDKYLTISEYMTLSPSQRQNYWQ
jgi:hypothetical protein